MLIQQIPETYHIWGEFGPGYDETRMVDHVIPESHNEKLNLFNLIKGLQSTMPDVKSVCQQAISDYKNAELKRLTEEYKERLERHQQSFWWWLPDPSPPTRSGIYVPFAFENELDRLLKTAKFIKSIDTIETFYFPIKKRMYENILNFEQNLSEITGK